MQADKKLIANEPVTVVQISQATVAIFPDLHFRQTFLFFVESGSKRVVDKHQNELIAEAGDVLIFPPESMVTMENRPVKESNYQALGIAYSSESVLSVFSDPVHRPNSQIQHLRSEQYELRVPAELVNATLATENLPDSIRDHRLLEPLVWLKQLGVNPPIMLEESLQSSIRRIIEGELTHAWTAGEVATNLAMSESTMRRHLAKNNQGFAKILLNTRLEKGLSLMQTTSASIAEIANDCGFKTPSHFADVFKKRFGIQPKNIRYKKN